MTRLSPEREAEIRLGMDHMSYKHFGGSLSPQSMCRDLLAEIDALREENRKLQDGDFDTVLTGTIDEATGNIVDDQGNVIGKLMYLWLGKDGQCVGTISGSGALGKIVAEIERRR